LGGNVRGGKVYSRWPGLNPNQLWQGRDLAVTTDFRSILGAAISSQFGLPNNVIAKIIPGYTQDNGVRSVMS
jgi:uncharacterized protein (DUF1501 family)